MRSGGILDRRVLAAFDFPLLLVLVSLLGLGLMVLYSAGFDPARPTLLVSFLSYQVENPVFVRQLYYFGLGFVLILVAVALNPQIYMRWSYWVYALCLLLLSAVLLIGSSSHGAQRWLEIAGFRFQPSEPAKLAFVFALARYMSKHIPSNERYRLMSLLVPGVIVLLPVVLILKQPDLGTALSFLAIGLAMILFIGVERRLLLSSGIVGLVSIIPVWSLLRPYQKRRVLALIDPHADPKGSGYHVIQSQIAVGSGEVTGKGYMQGTQTQLEFLPENTTDFVYSVLSEEWGFIGSLFVLGIYFLLIVLVLQVAKRSRDLFATLVCVGVAAHLFVHTVVNIGMVVGLLPVVGITLPFLSYGGSSALTFMFALGVVLGISMRRWTVLQV